MLLFDYGPWLDENTPLLPEHTFTNENFNLYYNGKHILYYQYLTEKPHHYFSFLDYHFTSLSKSFYFKQNISNKPIYKVLPKVIKKYNKLTEKHLGYDKSSYRKDLLALSYLLCSWNNMDSRSV